MRVVIRDKTEVTGLRALPYLIVAFTVIGVTFLAVGLLLASPLILLIWLVHEVVS